MDFILLACSLLVSILIYYIFDWIMKGRVGRMVDKIPGPLKLPFVGTLLGFIIIPRTEYLRLIRSMLKNFNPIVRTWCGRTPEVNLLTPENIELILNSSTQITKSHLYDFSRPWLGDGLLLSTGKKWQKHRKLLTPAFHFTILENFVEVFAEKSKLLIEQLESKTNEDIFDLHPYITRCTLDIICATAMGVEINAMSNPENEYVKNISNIVTTIIERIIKLWLHPDFIYYKTSKGKRYKKSLDVVHNFTTKVIRERREALVNRKNTVNDVEITGRKTRKAFLDILLETSTDLDDLELREEVDTFMFEGHDTTTGGICWTLFLLGNHLEIQEEVHEEIKTMFEESEGNLTISHLGNLRLLERCIKESLRIYPSVPVIARKLTEDVTLGQYTIPEGCAVNIPIFLVHWNETVFPKPEKFDPDRFLPENIKDRHPYAYIPFSAGPRNCIGQKFAMYEEKIMLAYILKKYKVTSIENQKTVKPLLDLTMKSKNGLLVKLELRNP